MLDCNDIIVIVNVNVLIDSKNWSLASDFYRVAVGRSFIFDLRVSLVDTANWPLMHNYICIGL